MPSLPDPHRQAYEETLKKLELLQLRPDPHAGDIDPNGPTDGHHVVLALHVGDKMLVQTATAADHDAEPRNRSRPLKLPTSERIPNNVAPTADLLKKTTEKFIQLYIHRMYESEETRQALVKYHPPKALTDFLNERFDNYWFDNKLEIKPEATGTQVIVFNYTESNDEQIAKLLKHANDLEKLHDKPGLVSTVKLCLMQKFHITEKPLAASILPTPTVFDKFRDFFKDHFVSINLITANLRSGVKLYARPIAITPEEFEQQLRLLGATSDEEVVHFGRDSCSSLKQPIEFFQSVRSPDEVFPISTPDQSLVIKACKEISLMRHPNSEDHGLQQHPHPMDPTSRDIAYYIRVKHIQVRDALAQAIAARRCSESHCLFTTRATTDSDMDEIKKLICEKRNGRLAQITNMSPAEIKACSSDELEESLFKSVQLTKAEHPNLSSIGEGNPVPPTHPQCTIL